MVPKGFAIRSVLLVTLLVACSVPATAHAAAGSLGAGGVLVDTTLAPTAADSRAAAARDASGRTVVASDLLVDDGMLLVVERRTAAGTLDASFGSGGRVTLRDFASAAFALRAVDTAGDGSVLVLGTTTGPFAPSPFVVVRLTPTGDLDPTFGATNGIAQPNFMAPTTFDATDLLVDSGGRVYVSGAATQADNQQFGVIRLLGSGDPDATWDGDGLALVDVPGGTSDIAHALAPSPTPGAAVLAVGSTDVPGSGTTAGTHFAAAHLTAGGGPVTAFDTDGIAVYEFGSALNESPLDVARTDAFAPTGAKWVAVGYANSDFGFAGGTYVDQVAAVAIKETGALDVAFDSGDGAPDGKVLIPPPAGYDGAIGTRVAASSGTPDNGAILHHLFAADLYGTTNALMVANHAAGALFPAWDSDGVAVVSDGVEMNAHGLLAEPGGGALVAGSTEQPANTHDVLLTRLTATGQPDGTFGPGGKARVDHGHAPGSRLAAIAPAGDGGAWIAGTTTRGSRSVPFVRRTRPDGSADPSFSGDGLWLDPAAFGTGHESFAVAAAPDGGVVVHVHQSESAVNRLVRLTATGALDTAFGGGSGIVTSESNAGVGLVVDGEGRTVTTVGNTFTPTGEVTRRLRDGALDPGFGAGGHVALPGAVPVVQALAVAPSGRVYVHVVTSATTSRLHALRDDGTPDPGWNGTGTVDLPDGSSVGLIAPASDGTVTVAGSTGADTWTGRFAANGVALRGPDAVAGLPTTMALFTIDRRGRIVGAGAPFEPAQRTFVARIEPVSGALDPSFGTAGVTGALDGLHAVALAATGPRIELAGVHADRASRTAARAAVDDDQVDLGTSISGPTSVGASESATLTVRVANGGPEPASATSVALTTTGGLGLGDVAGATCTGSGATRTCALGTVAAGTSAALTVKTVPGTGGLLRAAASSAVWERAPGDNTALHSLEVAPTAPNPDRTAPRVTLRLERKALRTLRRRGRIVVRLTLSERADVTFTATARRGTKGKVRTLRKRTVRNRPKGRSTVTIVLTSRTRRALRKGMTLTLRAVARDRAGNTGRRTTRAKVR